MLLQAILWQTMVSEDMQEVTKNAWNVAKIQGIKRHKCTRNILQLFQASPQLTIEFVLCSFLVSLFDNEKCQEIILWVPEANSSLYSETINKKKTICSSRALSLYCDSVNKVTSVTASHELILSYSARNEVCVRMRSREDGYCGKEIHWLNDLGSVGISLDTWEGLWEKERETRFCMPPVLPFILSYLLLFTQI